MRLLLFVSLVSGMLLLVACNRSHTITIVGGRDEIGAEVYVDGAFVNNMAEQLPSAGSSKKSLSIVELRVTKSSSKLTIKTKKGKQYSMDLQQNFLLYVIDKDAGVITGIS